MYMTKSPSVIDPAAIARPPMMIISTPITPTITVVAAPTADVPVIVLATFRNRRSIAVREDPLLALLGRVDLDHANAAERLAETAGDLGVDLAALAEQRAQPLERAPPSWPPNASSTMIVTAVRCQLR